MASLNYAETYSQELANAYPQVLHFAALRSTENDQRYSFVDTKTIRIPILTTTGMVDGDFDTINGTTARNFDNNWETKTLAHHRTWKTLVHPRHIVETNMVASIANITRAFNEQQKFPEMDDYLVSKAYADWVAAGGAATTTALDTSNILEVLDTLMMNMDEEDVPAIGRRLYVTPPVEKILKSAEGIARALMVTNNDGRIARLISNIDNVEIEKVPSKHMKTVYDFTIGSKIGASAKQINMFLAHPSCMITPVAYDFVKLDPPSAGSEGKWIYFEEHYSDVFLLNKRIKGLQFVVTA